MRVNLFNADSGIHIRPEIRALPAYKQGRPAAADAFKLSSNENPFPTPQYVLDAIDQATILRYPESTSRVLRERLAQMWSCDVDEVIVGAGSVSLLYQLILAVAGPGDDVVFAWRAFEAYPWLTTVAGATRVQVPNTPDHRHDLKAMAAAITDRTRAVIVCSPNNPTGTAVTTAEFHDFMSHVPANVLVILDEAYAEFSHDPDVVCGKQVKGMYPNVVTLRTFSKAYGLAGLRIGYGIGPIDILQAATSTAIPMVVTEQAQRAALAVLDHNDEAMAVVATICETRDRVWHEMVAQGWAIPRPHGNFVWLPTGDDTARVAELFEQGGIVTRVFAGEGVRITIGEPESVDVLLRIAQEIVSQ